VTQQHPINPPPKLMQQWAEQFEARGSLLSMFEDIYRAGADAELEACCEWLAKNFWLEPRGKSITNLRAARRPKPPSWKEQALAVLDDASNQLDAAHENIIRRALESLPD
jgi:hypothetical protein